MVTFRDLSAPVDGMSTSSDRTPARLSENVSAQTDETSTATTDASVQKTSKSESGETDVKYCCRGRVWILDWESKMFYDIGGFEPFSYSDPF